MHRPDRDTGKDSEKCREYHIFIDKQTRMETDVNAVALEGTTTIESNADLKDVTEQLHAMAGSFAQNVTGPDPKIKIEPGLETGAKTTSAPLSSASSASTATGGPDTRVAKDQHLAQSLGNDSKKVVANVADTLMTAKEIFAATKPTDDDAKEFESVVHEKMKTLIPQLSKELRKLEKSIWRKSLMMQRCSPPR